MYSMNNKSKRETVREFIFRVNSENEVAVRVEKKSPYEVMWARIACGVIVVIGIAVTVIDSLL